ncbi:hypothetical protein ABK249_31280 [Neorhizobium sp. Rsf11]|uniref:Uncharacterized protein n=2 Tax=Neorhizobium TaxID=1525371 RepID=A0ABV0MBW8_9HYPH|nr:hypothetical protein [Neorhizobium petrolearium]MCC2613743.1 hypothetical protein [Neorhizobium petrolearium]WGI72055.1 hypothetical protein QEO92_28350 [Neorhizobium petrolearium]
MTRIVSLNMVFVKVKPSQGNFRCDVPWRPPIFGDPIQQHLAMNRVVVHFKTNELKCILEVEMILEADDVVGTVSELVKRGYSREYRIKDRQLYDLSVDEPVLVSDICVDASVRFGSNPDAGDGTNIYAISDRSTRNKGLLIDPFDLLDQECSKELFARLKTAPRETLKGEEDVPSRYGLRKVYKSEFEKDPDRFVLRIGFPDFPPCPFAQSFSVLGFDTAEQQYVWLVTAILRDSRLARIPYQNADTPDND